MFEDMTDDELNGLFEKIFKEYHEKQVKFREEGEDIEYEDIKAGSNKWMDRMIEATEIVRLGSILSDISKTLRERNKKKK